MEEVGDGLEPGVAQGRQSAVRPGPVVAPGRRVDDVERDPVAQVADPERGDEPQILANPGPVPRLAELVLAEAPGDDRRGALDPRAHDESAVELELRDVAVWRDGERHRFPRGGGGAPSRAGDGGVIVTDSGTRHPGP